MLVAVENTCLQIGDIKKQKKTVIGDGVKEFWRKCLAKHQPGERNLQRWQTNHRMANHRVTRISQKTIKNHTKVNDFFIVTEKIEGHEQSA